MTRLFLVVLVVIVVGPVSVDRAEAGQRTRRRNLVAEVRVDKGKSKAPRPRKAAKPARTALAKPGKARTAWAGDQCTEQSRGARRVRARVAVRAVRPEPAAEPDEIVLEERVEPAAPAVGPVAVAPADPRWRIAAGAAAGGNSIGMRIARSEGGGGLGTAVSAAYGVSGTVSYRVAGHIHAGLGIDGVLSGPLGQGIQYRTAEQTAGAVPFEHHQVDARAELAYRGAIELAARAGYHYAHLKIEGDVVDMPIVGEAIAGYTVGLSAVLPRGRVALSAVLDVMPAGVQAPTVPVTDGMLYGIAASGAWAGAGLSYRLGDRWLGTAAYRYGRSTIALTDGATDPTTATRVDQSHTLLAGVGLSL